MQINVQDVDLRIALTTVTDFSSETQNTLIYVALFASMLVLVTLVIGTMYKVLI